MTHALIVEPEAEAEIIDAANWYEARNPGLGPQFILSVEAALGAIQRNPHAHQGVFREVRRAQVRRFPYGVMYVVTEHEIIVVACIHGRRNPNRWKRRAPG